MKHEWIAYGGTPSLPGTYRRCKRCRAIQQLNDVQNWGRIVGYRWYPLAGRCRPLKWKRPVLDCESGHQETHCGRYGVWRDSIGRWRAYLLSMDEPLTGDGFPTRWKARAYCEADAREINRKVT
jgi:hypothetical protein